MVRLRLHPDVRKTNVHGGPVLINFETGNWAGLTPEAESFLERWMDKDRQDEDLTPDQEELVQVLGQLGFLMSYADSIEAPQTLAPFSQPRPRVAYVHVSFVCNLTCPTCYSSDNRRNRHPDLETNQMKLIFRKLREGGVTELIISGGEPFARKDMVELLRYCRQDLDFSHVVVITNGTLLKEVRLLKGIVDQMAISVDGYDEETNAPIRGKGNFSKALSTVQRLQAEGIPCHIISTLHKGNAKDAQRYLDLGDELGVPVSFSLFTPSGEGAANIQALRLGTEDLISLGELLARYPGKASVAETPCAEGLRIKDRCGIGSELISVHADGTVYPCHITMLPGLAMGSLLFQDLEEIMRTSPIAQDCRQLTVDNVGFCKGCEYKFFCGGGCRANALHVTQDLTAHDPHCDMNKAFLRLAVTAIMGPAPSLRSGT